MRMELCPHLRNLRGFRFCFGNRATSFFRSWNHEMRIFVHIGKVVADVAPGIMNNHHGRDLPAPESIALTTFGDDGFHYRRSKQSSNTPSGFNNLRANKRRFFMKDNQRLCRH